MDQPGSNAASSTARDAARPGLASALDQLWIRFLPEILIRVDALEAAASVCGAGDLPAELRSNAHAAAHKLAGTLGTFNLARGTELAREFEVLFEEGGVLDTSQAGRLGALAAELRRIVESRT